MVTWLKSLFAQADRSGQKGAELEGATQAEDSTTQPADTDHADGGAPDSAATQERDGVCPAQQLLDTPPVSKQEVYLELGLQPAEFLVWLVRNGGGQIWQGELVEMTGWSKSTVSRVLSSLKSDSVIRRVRIGRRKLIGLPGELPDITSTVDGPPAESPGG